MRIHYDPPPDDEPTKDTHFYKILRCHVHDPDEALAYAAGHRRRAAEARSQIPTPIEGYRDRSQAR